MIHCLFLHRFRIGFVVEYWIGEVVLCSMWMLWLLFQSCGRDITWDLVRGVGSILSVKGLAFGVWVSKLLLLLMLNRSVMRKVNLGAVLRKTWWDYHPMMAFFFLNVSHRRGIEMVLQLQFAFAISMERRQRRSFVLHTLNVYSIPSH